MKIQTDLLIIIILFFLASEFLLKNFSFALAFCFLLIISLIILKIARYNFLFAALPIFLLIGIIIFLPLIESEILQHIAIIFFLVPLYLSIDSAKELRRFFIEQQNLFDDKEKNNRTDHLAIIQSVAFLTFFLWASALSENYLNFHISIFSAMILFFAIAAFIFYLALKISNPKSLNLLFYSFIAGFVIAELFWTLSFSPLGHFSISAVLLIVFWFWRDILQRYFENKLSKKIILQNIIFGAVGLGLIFLSAKWLPI